MECSAAVNGSSVPLSPQKQPECASSAALPPSLLPSPEQSRLLEHGLVGQTKEAESKRHPVSEREGKKTKGGADISSLTDGRLRRTQRRHEIQGRGPICRGANSGDCVKMRLKKN